MTSYAPTGRPMTSLLLTMLMATLTVTRESDAACTADNKTCPTHCRCGTLPDGVRVECSDRNLQQLPEKLPTRTVELLARKNNITTLNADDLKDCTHIRKIDLSKNGLESLDSESFLSNGDLEELFMNDNRLRYDRLPTGLFRSQTKLVTLRLENNNWMNSSDYNDELFRPLENLKTLTVDGIPNIHIGTGVSSLRGLETLTVCGGLFVVRNDTFASLSPLCIKNLTIRTGYNLYDLEPMSFGHFHCLQTLDLSYNRGVGIENVSNAWWGLQFTNISSLVLSLIIGRISQATTLSTSFFEFLDRTNIETLIIDKNNIVVIEPMLSRSLPKLRYLVVSYNLLSSTYSFIYDIWKLKHLEYIDASNQAKRYILSESSMREKSVQINRLRRCVKHKRSGVENTMDADCLTPKSQQCPKWVSEGFVIETWCVPLPPKLSTVILSASVNIDLSVLPFFVFFGGSNLRLLDYSNNGFRTLTGPMIFTQPTTNLTVDLSDNRLSCMAPDMFKISATLGCVFSEFLLSGNSLGGQLKQDTNGDTFFYVRNITRLNLDRNDITILPRGVFRHLHQLEKLNLSQNFLRVVEFEFGHMDQLSLLDISNNLLTSLDDSTISKLSQLIQQRKSRGSSLTISLIENPMQCTCESLRFLEWIEANGEHLVDWTKYSCLFNGSVADFTRLSDNILVELRFVCSKSLAVVIAGVLVALVLVLVTMSACFYRYRWEIRYFCLKLTQRAHHYDMMIADRAQYDYDAFVVYDSHDRDWVVDELVPQLEQRTQLENNAAETSASTSPLSVTRGAIRLCIHERDFIPGEEILSNIWKYMERSRKTILVVSRNFISSNYCNYELELARMLSVEKGRNLVLPVLLEPVDIVCMSESLRWIIRKLTYLEWPVYPGDRDEFWDKLAEAIVDAHGGPLASFGPTQGERPDSICLRQVHQ